MPRNASCLKKHPKREAFGVFLELSEDELTILLNYIFVTVTLFVLAPLAFVQVTEKVVVFEVETTFEPAVFPPVANFVPTQESAFTEDQVTLTAVVP